MNEEKPVILRYRSFAGIEATDTQWLWYPYLPRGKIVLLSAKPGTGKTFLALWLCAVLSSGSPFWGEAPDRRHAPRITVYQTAEDGVADTLKKRLEHIRPIPDYDLIFNVDESERSLSLTEPDNIECILNELHPDLMIFDPLQAYLGADVDMHRANQVRPVMARIGALAEKYNCTILFIMHNSKMQQSDALYGVLGSVDIPAVSRSMLMLDKNPENESELILAHVKSSLARHGQSIIFHIDHGNPVFDGYSDLTAEELYQKKKGGRSAEFMNTALDLLRKALDEHNGYINIRDVEEMSRQHNINIRTFQRARKDLQLNYVKIGYTNPQVFWVSPERDVTEFRKQMNESTSF